MSDCRPAARLSRLLLCLLLAAGTAHAAEPKKKEKAAAAPASGVASLGKGAASEAPILTRDELRACLKQQVQLLTAVAGLADEQRALDAEKSSIKQQGAALQGELTTLDRTAASAVQAYNAKTVEHEARIDAYNARSQPFNAKVAALKTQRDGWVKDCSNRRYMENDLIIIKAGR